MSIKSSLNSALTGALGLALAAAVTQHMTLVVGDFGHIKPEGFAVGEAGFKNVKVTYERGETAMIEGEMLVTVSGSVPGTLGSLDMSGEVSVPFRCELMVHGSTLTFVEAVPTAQATGLKPVLPAGWRPVYVA